MADVTNLISCSTGASLTVLGTLDFPSGNQIVQIDNTCYELQGFGDSASSDPFGEINGYFETCEECAVAVAGSVYRLRNCLDDADFIETLTPGISAYVGSILKIGTKCYSVLVVTPDKFQGILTDVDLSSPDDYPTCDSCLTRYVKATHCATGQVIYLPSGAHTSSITNTVRLSNNNCYTVEEIFTGEVLSTENLTVSQYYGVNNCNACLIGTFFRMEDCNNSNNVLFIPEGQGPLVQGTHGDKIIRVNVLGENTCWKVTVVSLPLDTSSSAFPGSLLSVHTNCVDCEVDGLIEIPADLTGATLSMLGEGSEDCAELTFTNLTQLYDETLYAEFVLPELVISFEDGTVLTLDSTTIPITDNTWTNEFNPLNPTTPVVITLDDIAGNLASGILTNADGDVLDTLPWDSFPDGVHTILWQFRTLGDTTGFYSTEYKQMYLCNAKECYTTLANEYLNKGCIDCGDNPEEQMKELTELMVLIDAARYNMQIKNYECASKVIKALGVICKESDCGCLQ